MMDQIQKVEQEAQALFDGVQRLMRRKQELEEKAREDNRAINTESLVNSMRTLHRTFCLKYWLLRSLQKQVNNNSHV